jgi:RNA polymerase sigma-70 factor (ECF subfamily)
MEPGGFSEPGRLERLRDYLRLLARIQLGACPTAHIDPSDIVQQSLMEAFEKRDQFRGATSAEYAAWLRRILSHNMADALRAQGRQKRDVSRERSLEQQMEESSAQLGDWLAGERSTPSEHAQRHEQAILLADALARLPEHQREALVLHYWQGCSLAEIGVSLDRSTTAVAGLLKRGLKHLRTQLDASPEWSEP